MAGEDNDASESPMEAENEDSTPALPNTETNATSEDPSIDSARQSPAVSPSEEASRNGLEFPRVEVKQESDVTEQFASMGLSDG